VQNTKVQLSNFCSRLPYRKLYAILLVLLAAALLVAHSGLAAASATTASSPDPAALAALGRKVFFDNSLSASGHMACASCHSPAYAYGPPNGLAVQLGGSALDRQGPRSVPSLRYTLNRTPIWHKEFISSAAERLMEGEEPPTGGFGWDGRFNSLHDQAAFPLLAPNEMANASREDVVAKLKRTDYADDFRKVFGAEIFEAPQAAFAALLTALERFQLDDPTFHPFSSKYDDYLDGKAALTPRELHGLALFDDPNRGNCATCHLDRKGVNGVHPTFTDYQFEALGVPRNPEIHANASPDYFDMGLCGPMRIDQAKQVQFCGLFKTPTLRNVAARSVFFHNGRFHTLRDALRFYVRRDTDPQLWYPVTPSGTIDKFDDLPVKLRANADVIDEPLTHEKGQPPVWTDAEIDDVIAFLTTLTDRDVETASRQAVNAAP
jgi:cytochrome c peroxidase